MGTPSSDDHWLPLTQKWFYGTMISAVLFIGSVILFVL